MEIPEQESKLDPNDKALKELINWTIDNEEVRKLMKDLIILKENHNDIWIFQELGSILQKGGYL